MTAATFWKNGCFTEHIVQEISGACIGTNGIEVTYVASGDRKNTYVRNWELKRGEIVCSKGVHFRKLMVTFTGLPGLRVVKAYPNFEF